MAATVAATVGGFVERRKRKIFRRHVSRHGIGRTFVRLGAGFFVPPVRVPGWQKAFCQLVSAAAAGGIRRGGIKTDDAVSQASPLRVIP